jgi:CRISPR/Cas system CMR subunit Cmr6 (Cas7 group RAMP superfamily)
MSRYHKQLQQQQAAIPVIQPRAVNPMQQVDHQRAQLQERLMIESLKQQMMQELRQEFQQTVQKKLRKSYKQLSKRCRCISRENYKQLSKRCRRN